MQEAALTQRAKDTEKPDTEGGAGFGSNSSTLTRKVVWVGYGSTVLLNLLINVQFDHRINFVIGQLHNFVISLYTQWIFRGLKVFHGLFVHYFNCWTGISQPFDWSYQYEGLANIKQEIIKFKICLHRFICLVFFSVVWNITIADMCEKETKKIE